MCFMAIDIFMSNSFHVANVRHSNQIAKFVNNLCVTFLVEINKMAVCERKVRMYAKIFCLFG